MIFALSARVKLMETQVRHETRRKSEGVCCMRDEGRPLGAGLQGQAPNHLKLLWLKARVVSVKAKGAEKRVRYGLGRLTRVNH